MRQKDLVRAAAVSIVFAITLSVSALVAAQQTVNFASAAGRVTDSTGAVIVGAQVTARQTETNISTTAIADTEGRFRFAYLRPGSYEISIRQPGFRSETRSLTLSVGAAVDLPITLGVAALDTSVIVNE